MPGGELPIRDLRNQAGIRAPKFASLNGSSTYCARGDQARLYFSDSKLLILAERVGFGPDQALWNL
jgi:hypothetical protein